MERRNTERRNDGTRSSGTGFFFCFFIFIFFLTKKKQQRKSKYISQNKGHAYILYPSKSIYSQVVEFISCEDFKEKRDCPSDLLAPIETMKRTKLKQVKNTVDKKKTIERPQKLLFRKKKNKEQK